MIEFILFTVVCLTIFTLANTIQKQFKVKSLQQPIRIETEEELRKKQLLRRKSNQFRD